MHINTRKPCKKYNGSYNYKINNLEFSNMMCENCIYFSTRPCQNNNDKIYLNDIMF